MRLERPRGRRTQHQPKFAGERVAHDPIVGTATTWSARAALRPRRSRPPSRVVKRRVGSIAVLDRLLDGEAIEDRERAARAGPQEARAGGTMSTERNRDMANAVAAQCALLGSAGRTLARS
jgi:hypothetical protein